jgi:hypothetical protein
MTFWDFANNNPIVITIIGIAFCIALAHILPVKVTNNYFNVKEK